MACVRHAHLPPHRAARLIAEARQLHARKALPPFPLRPLPHPQRREISAAHPAPGWEVWLYAVLAAKFALRDEQASTVDEAVFAQRVDAALAGLEGSLNMALGLRRRANKEVAARELDDVVQVRGSLRNGYPSRCGWVRPRSTDPLPCHAAGHAPSQGFAQPTGARCCLRVRCVASGARCLLAFTALRFLAPAAAAAEPLLPLRPLPVEGVQGGNRRCAEVGCVPLHH